MDVKENVFENICDRPTTAVANLEEFLNTATRVEKGSANCNLYRTRPKRGNFFISDEVESNMLEKTPKTQVSTFFQLLWDCYLSGNVYCWFEKQYYTIPQIDKETALMSTKKVVEKSGVFIDIDAYQFNEKRMLFDHYETLVTDFVELLNEYIDINARDFIYKTYAVVTHNPEITQCEKDGQKMYKDGIHILFPGVKLSKSVKKFLLKKYSEKMSSGLFRLLKLYKPHLAIDEHVYSCPMKLYGSKLKAEKPPHIIANLYKVKLNTHSGDIKLKDCTHLFKYEKAKFSKKNGFTPATYVNNVCLELSLLYEGKLIKSREFSPKSTVLESINSVFIESFAKEDHSITKQVDMLTITDPEAAEVARFVALFNKQRGTEYNPWKNVVTAIARINLDYKPIAILFSMRSDEETWKKDGRVGLNKLWDMVKKQTKSDFYPRKEEKNKSLGLIKKWAYEDNPVEYAKVRKQSYFATICDFANKSMGKLNHQQLAHILHLICGDDKYVFTPQRSSGNRLIGVWYEYITEKDLENLGYDDRMFLHKYKKYEFVPKSFDTLISEELGKYINNAKTYLKSIAQEKDPEDAKVIEIICKNLGVTQNRLGDNTTIDHVKKRCEASLFREDRFEDKLNRHNNVLGVLNGILVIDKTGKQHRLINEPTREYIITRTCRTFYKPYDPNDKYVKILEKIIADILPNAADRKGILIWLSKSLLKHDLQKYFFIWYSKGGSGKSILCNLLCAALGIFNEGNYGTEFGYVATMNPDIFTTTKRDPSGHDSALMGIDVARVIMCAEGSAKNLNMPSIKRFHDNFPIRDMYKTQRSIKVGARVIYTVNEPPGLGECNFATLRRILYYHFPTKFCADPKHENEKKIDTSLEDIHKKPQIATAMLAILTHHLRIYYNEFGGDMNKVIKSCSLEKQTLEYYHKYDYLEKYINDKLVPKKGSSIDVSEFINQYSLWYRTIDSSVRPKYMAVRNALEDSSIKNFIRKKIDNKEYISDYEFRANVEPEKMTNEEKKIENTVEQMADSEYSEEE